MFRVKKLLVISIKIIVKDIFFKHHSLKREVPRELFKKEKGIGVAAFLRKLYRKLKN